MKKSRSSSNNSFIIAFVVAGVCIGVLVIAQFKSQVTANSYKIDEINAQKELLESFNRDRNVLKERLANLRTEISKHQESLSTQMENTDLQKLEDLKKKIGLTTEKGNGFEIMLADGPAGSSDNTSYVHAADLRDLINVLRTGRAEAISINGQRVVYSTSITSVGNTILVNNVHVSPPFKILVIGDSEFLLQRIKDQKAYPDLYNRIQAQKVYFTMKNLAQLVIPAYDGEFSLRYTQKNS